MRAMSCALFLTVSATVSAAAAGQTVTITLTGDVGFSRNHSPVNPGGVLKYGRRQPFAEALAAIRDLQDRPAAPQRHQRNLRLELGRELPSLRHLVLLRNRWSTP